MTSLKPKPLPSGGLPVMPVLKRLKEKMVERRRVLDLIKKLPSYAEVGRTLGISRERVRQISEESGVLSHWKPPNGYIPLEDAITELGYAPNSLKRLITLGAVPCLRKKGRMYIKAQEFYVGFCPCGKPISKYRRRFCSDNCLALSQKQSHTRSIFRSFHNKRKRQNINTPYFAIHDVNKSSREYIHAK